MITARIVATTVLFFMIITSISAPVCKSQERREIVGGEKFVWDPLLKQWVHHQGTRTINANRGTNATPKNSFFDGVQSRPADNHLNPTVSNPRPRDIVGGEKFVWDPLLKQWVHHRGTRTINANRGINAPPKASTLSAPHRDRRSDSPRPAVTWSESSTPPSGKPHTIINPYGSHEAIGRTSSPPRMIHNRFMGQHPGGQSKSPAPDPPPSSSVRTQRNKK
jgi:hypothetical protein